MRSYTPEKLIAISRYKQFFPTLPAEIQRDICHSDIINYGDLPYIDFKRSQTLCQGGDCCDFVRHPTDAGDGWERTKSI